MPNMDVEGGNIYYEIHGSGRPVLCPGGWAITTGDGYQRLPEVLRNGYMPIVYDHRGLGRSTETRPTETTADYAADAAELLRKLDLGPVLVYGHGGLGACVAQHLAARHSSSVDGLVLAAGWAGKDPYKHTQARVFVDLLSGVGFDAFQRYGAMLINTPEYFNNNWESIFGANGNWAEFRETPNKLLHAIKVTIEHEAREVLPNITAPTLVINNELDIVDPPRFGDELRRLIPNSRLEIIGNTPHATRTSPEGVRQLNALLSSFFSGLS